MPYIKVKSLYNTILAFNESTVITKICIIYFSPGGCKRLVPGILKYSIIIILCDRLSSPIII